MIDKKSANWQKSPMLLKWLFVLNFFSLRPSRNAARNIEIVSHVFGFAFCVLGLISEPALVGGLIMLSNAYFFRLHTWLGVKYGVWYDNPDLANPTNTSV